GSGALRAAPSTQQCHTIRSKTRVRRWAWIPRPRRVHGRRVVIRRAGRIVHVHARVWRRKTALRVVCTPTAAVVAPPGATTALTPLPLAALEPPAPPPPAAPPAAPPPQLPSNTTPPTITGTALQGQILTATPGTWSGSPSAFSYAWLRCDPAAAYCTPIPLATTSATYVLTEADVGGTLRVAVVASNAAGASAPASSAQTDLVAAAERVLHLEYVLQDGVMSVYDMDHEFQLVKTISLPQTQDEVRGVSVAPATHTMYIMHGGDGPINGSGNGSVLAYDLVAEQVVWDPKLNSGVDSGQVSPDATKLYVPTGENTASGIWN